MWKYCNLKTLKIKCRNFSQRLRTKRGVSTSDQKYAESEEIVLFLAPFSLRMRIMVDFRLQSVDIIQDSFRVDAFGAMVMQLLSRNCYYLSADILYVVPEGKSS